MNGSTILVVDDDQTTIDIIRLRLERDGNRVIEARDGEAALAAAASAQPDLIVLDLMMPRLDGLDVCHILRRDMNSNVPIIMVTARASEDDTLAGLECGADDYLTKPFSPRELSARVSAVLRRTKPAGPTRPGVIRHGDLVVDLPRVAVTLRGAPLALTPTEFSLLSTLIAEPERNYLLNCGYGRGFSVLEVLDAVDRIPPGRVLDRYGPRRAQAGGRKYSDRPESVNFVPATCHPRVSAGRLPGEGRAV